VAHAPRGAEAGGLARAGLVAGDQRRHRRQVIRVGRMAQTEQRGEQ
jgi:hypothetical protein